MKAMSQAEQKNFWKCGHCGFTVEGDNPPKTCPSCQQECEFKNVTCYLPECGGPGHTDPRLK
jgi:rubrerythrin